jgi:uncharacterized protein
MKITTYFIVATFLFLQSCHAQKAPKIPANKDNNTLLWEISGNGLKMPSYLFGTFHMMCKKDILLSKNLETALAASKEVYFEMDLDDPAIALGGLFFMNMKNKTLKDLYTEAEYNKVKQFFKDSVRMDISMFSKMKPMMLEAMLYPRLMPCKNASGVEMEIMAKAQKQKKEIKGFETIQFQASMFDSIPYEVQAKALLKDIDSSALARKYFDKMVAIYKSQQTDSLMAIMDNDEVFGESENNDLLLRKRNENWVKQLPAILKTNNIFMAVGAAHLYGKDGVIALLRKQGYKVRGLKNVD